MRIRIAVAAAFCAMAPAGVSAAAPPRLMNPGAWLQDREAPPATLKRGEVALTALDLTVAPDGTVLECKIVYSSNPNLNDYACLLFRTNARYEPASGGGDVRIRREFVDWSGSKNATDAKTSRAAAPSRGPGSDNWVTPDDLPNGALQKGEVVTSNVGLSVSPEGTISGCWVTLPSEKPALDELVCTLMKQRGRYKPALDADGETAHGFAFTTVHWQFPVD